jgi:epoxide hydrolase 4
VNRSAAARMVTAFFRSDVTTSLSTTGSRQRRSYNNSAMQYIVEMNPELNLQTRYFQTADGIRLHAKVCGPEGAPTLLFVHGFPEFWYSWRRQLAEFSKDFRCVAIDLRGFNLSSQPTEVSAYKPALLIADIAAVINEIGAPVHAVVAHDWGGAVAWSLAAQHPELMRKFVVLNSPHAITFARALATDPAQQAASQYMNWLRREGSEGVLAEDDFKRLFDMLGDLSEGERVAYRACWQQGLTGGVNLYRVSPLHPDTPENPGRMALLFSALKPAQFAVNVPTQIIWGLADRALMPILLDGIEQHVSDLRLHQIVGAGHWLARENSHEVNAVIRNFIAI